MKKLKARALHDHVIEEIGRRIISGELPPGQPLPTEAELCAALGVSRTALREALRVLAAKGLVEPKRKVGTLVRLREHWNFLDADILSWHLEVGDSDRAIDELYELRHLIEPLAASLAAQHAQAADILALRKAYAQMQDAGDDGERIAAPVRLSAVLPPRTLHRRRAGRQFCAAPRYPRAHVQSMPAHKKVLDAIVDHDASTARLAMQQLIEDSQRDARAVHGAKNRHRGGASSARAARG